MSESNPPAGTTDSADPSMEEILASIRRILNEDEATTGTDAVQAEPAPTGDDVLVLDRSMMVTPEQTPADVESVVEAPVLDIESSPAPAALHPPPDVTSPLREPPVLPPPSSFNSFAPPASPPPEGSALLAPETAAAAASSVDGLLRTLAATRSTQVYRGGPTIEDLVREEIRPLLKYWLDMHLPPLVERLVQTEIERVVGRSVS